MEKNHNFEEQLRKYIKENPEKTQREIAKYFGCSIKRIVDYIKICKIPYEYKGTRAVKIKEEDLINYIISNPEKTQREIGKALGIDKEIVNRCIKRNKIKRQIHKKKYYSKREEEELIDYMDSHPYATIEEAIEELGIDKLELKSKDTSSKKGKNNKEKIFFEKIIILASNYPKATPEQIEKAFLKRQRKKVPVRFLLVKKRLELLSNGNDEEAKIISEILSRGLEKDGEDR